MHVGGVIALKRLLVLLAAFAVLSLTAFIGSAAAGVFVVNPPGLEGSTATCVGPPPPSETPNAAPWNAHFNSGGVVTHPGDCPDD